MDEITVEHDPAAARFFAQLDGMTARLDYRLDGGRIEMYHVEVPVPYRGRRIAARVTREALEFARAEGLSVVPRCPYVAAFIRRHPEYQTLVAER